MPGVRMHEHRFLFLSCYTAAPSVSIAFPYGACPMIHYHSHLNVKGIPLLALALLFFSPDWATLTAIMSWLDFCFDWILRACLEFGFYTITKCFGCHSYWWFFSSLIDQGPPHGSAWWLLFWWGHPDSAGPFPCLKNGPLLMSSERCTRPLHVIYASCLPS